MKKTTDSTKKSKIGIVYCRFQQFQGQKTSKIRSNIIKQFHLGMRIYYYFITTTAVKQREKSLTISK